MRLTFGDDVIVLDIIRLNAIMTATVDVPNSTSQSAVSNAMTLRGGRDKHSIGYYSNGTVENDKPRFGNDKLEKAESSWIIVEYQ